MGCFCSAISRSITVATSTSSNTRRCLLPLRYACRDLFSSTAFTKHVIMKAVNDKDSPVFALCSCKNLRALVTSTSIKPCIMDLRWAERSVSANARRSLGYGITLYTSCCLFIFAQPLLVLSPQVYVSPCQVSLYG